MKFGRFDIFSLSEGLFKLTDSFMEEHEKGSIPGPDTQSPGRWLVSINVVVCIRDNHIILCDTGIGTKHRDQACDVPTPAGKSQSIRERLNLINIKAEDVTHVILTHLHYDHAGGLTCYDDNRNLMLTYPKAKVYVQSDEWDAAIKSETKETRGYLADNWELYRDSSNLRIIDGDESVLDGIELKKTNGHTHGHQIIKINSGDGRFAGIFGDLIPTPWHVNKGLKMKFDVNPDQSKSMRINLIDQAVEEEWLLFFYHAPHIKIGKAYTTSGNQVKVKKIDGLEGMTNDE